MTELRDREIVRALLDYIGENPDREGLQETPDRVLRMWDKLTSGYNEDPKTILKSFADGAEGVDQMVFQGAIPFWSTCEHHLAPFFGYAHIGYIPNGRVVGLSKLARITDVYARRLSVQERITTQIADAMMECLDPIGVGVVLQCRHSCIESRGVEKRGSITVTSALRGCMKDNAEARSEFLSMVQTATQGMASI